MTALINASTSSGVVVTSDTSGSLAIQNNGTTAMTVTSGQVGVGTTSPADVVDVTRSSSANSTGGLTLTNTDTSGYGSAVSWNLKLNSVAGVYGRIKTEAASTTNTFMQFSSTVASTLAEKMRISSYGFLKASNTGTYLNAAGTYHELLNNTVGDNVLIVTNNASSGQIANIYNYAQNVAPNNALGYFFRNDDSGGQRATFYGNGGLANYQANNVNLSDRREKTNINPAQPYLDKICSVPVVTFNYIDQDLKDDDGLTLGVIAQDVQAVMPEMVHESNWGVKDGEEKMRLSIYQTDLQYALMKSIQELKAELDATKAEIAALKGTV